MLEEFLKQRCIGYGKGPEGFYSVIEGTARMQDGSTSILYCRCWIDKRSGLMRESSWVPEKPDIMRPQEDADEPGRNQ